MKYLLDTNICIAFLHRKEKQIVEKLQRTPPAEVVLCSVVKAELFYGAYKSQFVEKNLHELRKFFEFFESPVFDDAAAEFYGQIYASLKTQGIMIGLNDLLIASIALANQLTVVTRNRKEFSRIAGLRVEEW